MRCVRECVCIARGAVCTVLCRVPYCMVVNVMRVPVECAVCASRSLSPIVVTCLVCSRDDRLSTARPRRRRCVLSTPRLMADSGTPSLAARAAMNLAFASVSNCTLVSPFIVIDPVTICKSSSEVPSGQ